MKTGALPSQAIRDLIRHNQIINGNEKNVQPSSLDLTIGDRIYRMPSIFLPRPEERIKDLAKAIGAEEFNFDYPLERNTPYLVKLREQLSLPADVYAYANPKSSTGRCGIHATLLADGIPRFDSAGVKGYQGELWLLVRPEAFRVKLNPGDALVQMRFFYSDTRFNQAELETFFAEYQPLYRGDNALSMKDLKVSDRDGGVILTVDLRNEIVGWRSEGSHRFLDFSKRDYYRTEDFFTPIKKARDNMISLRRGDFYILYSRERVAVPPDFAVEIAPVDVRSGEYRSHYAGFVDPGWGYSPDKALKGASLVLEVRTFEDNLILRDNQPVAKIVYERMAARPDVIYGALGAASNYHAQSGPRLSKHFRLDNR